MTFPVVPRSEAHLTEVPELLDEFKISQFIAGYVNLSPFILADPVTKTDGVNCGNCGLFMPEFNRCKIVIGDINPLGVCVKWIWVW